MPVIDVSSVPSYQPLDLVTRGLPLFAVLYIQAYLLLRDGSRSRTWRVGLWPLGMWFIKRAWLDRRFVNPYAIHLSFMCGCASVFYIMVLSNWSLSPTGPQRIARSSPRHSTALDALHLVTSTRLLGWSDGLSLNTAPQGISSKAWQRQVFWRHIRHLTIHALALDVVLYVYQMHLPYGDPSGADMPVEAQRFSPLLRPCYLSAITLSVGFAFYSALCAGYHLVAVLGMLVGVPAEEWPQFSHAPWRSTSLSDFWGRRWHQIFRSGFTAPSYLVPNRYRPYATPLIAFALSAIMHDLGQINVTGSLSPRLCTSRFFLSQALGVLAERLFRLASGRRVQGPLGAIWFWTYILVTSRQTVRWWLIMGIAGGRVIPESCSLVRRLVALL